MPTLIEIGLMIAIIIFASHLARHLFGSPKRHPRAAATTSSDASVEAEKIRAKDRAEAREMYERLVREKLDVLKTAITMGYGRNHLTDLDERLEKLIGQHKLEQLLSDDPRAPLADQDLLDTDLQAEMDRLSRQRGKD
jgi:hypothetical protein